jgi:hypothetical protein
MPAPYPKPLVDPSAKDAERFWSKVDIRGEDECWPWKAGCFKNGYGQFYYGGRESGHNVLANRMAFKLFYGGDPFPCMVLHRCDNPPCCNPEHFFLGDGKDNSRDCMEKGRHTTQVHGEKLARGERIHNSTFTADDVRFIRDQPHTRHLVRDLAKKYGTSTNAIYQVLYRYNWKHVP